MPPKRLYEQIHDRCLPPGTLGHDACHARDAEEIARLTRGTETLRALLQRLEWDKAGYCPLCFTRRGALSPY